MIPTFLTEEKTEIESFYDINNCNFISVKDIDKADCDILYVVDKNILKNIIKDIYFENHNLLELENIRYIIINDKKLLQLMVDHFEDVYDTKIEESYIGYKKEGVASRKKLFRFFRIYENKLYTVVKNFNRYFYIPDKDGEKIAIDGKKVTKCTQYWDYEGLHYEKDINMMTRYAIDQAKKGRLKLCKKYRIAWWDIETDSSVDSVNTPAAILSIVAQDSFTGEVKYWEIREFDEVKEKEMLEDFFIYISKMDCIAGFNSAKFDVPYLINRAKKLGVDMSLLTGIRNVYPSCKFRGKDAPFPWFNIIPGIHDIDLMGLADKSIGYMDVKLPDKKLDTLGKYILGEKKVETDTPSILFKNKEFAKLKQYNIQDVNITRGLDEKLGLIEVLKATQELVPGLNLDAAVWNSKIIDFYLLSKFDLVMPSIDRDREKDIKGAIVTETVPGIHENAAVMDVAGMYPSLISTFNISPDTKDPTGDIKIGNTYFSSNKKGILVKLVEDFTKLRKHYKKLKKDNENSPDYKMFQLKEFTIKKVLASTYGVFGFIGFRFFDNDIANAITESGRDLLTHMNKVAEYNNYIVISSDTDGNCIKHKDNNPDFKDIEFKMNDSIKEWVSKYTDNEDVINNHRIVIEYETLFHRVIFTKAKKKYMGLISIEKGKTLDTLKFYGKGNELMRKDTPAGMKAELKKIIMQVLNNDDKSKNIDIIKNNVKEIKKSIQHWTTDDLIIYKEINRDFDDYKVRPIHVRGALNSNKYLGTDFSRQNYKGGYVFVKSKKHPEADVLFMNNRTKLNEDFKIDFDKYFEKFILDKVLLIFGDTIYKEVERKDSLLTQWM